MTDTATAEANGKIHYANCKRLIELCGQVLKDFPGAPHPPIGDLQAGELTVAGQDVVKTLQQASDFINQPGIKEHYNANYLKGLKTAIQAVHADIVIGVQIGTGGPNPWKATFHDTMVSAQNWTNSYVDPYNLGLARIPT